RPPRAARCRVPSPRRRRPGSSARPEPSAPRSRRPPPRAPPCRLLCPRSRHDSRRGPSTRRRRGARRSVVAAVVPVAVIATVVVAVAVVAVAVPVVAIVVAAVPVPVVAVVPAAACRGHGGGGPEDAGQRDRLCRRRCQERHRGDQQLQCLRRHPCPPLSDGCWATSTGRDVRAECYPPSRLRSPAVTVTAVRRPGSSRGPPPCGSPAPLRPEGRQNLPGA